MVMWHLKLNNDGMTSEEKAKNNVDLHPPFLHTPSKSLELFFSLLAFVLVCQRGAKVDL